MINEFHIKLRIMDDQWMIFNKFQEFLDNFIKSGFIFAHFCPKTHLTGHETL